MRVHCQAAIEANEVGTLFVRRWWREVHSPDRAIRAAAIRSLNALSFWEPNTEMVEELLFLTELAMAISAGEREMTQDKTAIQVTDLEDLIGAGQEMARNLDLLVLAGEEAGSDMSLERDALKGWDRTVRAWRGEASS